jgi:uncharacterized protein (DUF1501 family)
MAITRRQFLKRTTLATAGMLAGPSLFGNPFVRRAMAQTIGDRYLIVLFLDGGNDGFNTVVPVNDGGGDLRTQYEAARKTGSGGLRLDPVTDLGGTLIGTDPNTGAQLGIHPGFAGFPGVTAGAGGFKTLYDAGELAVFQGCGYPSYSLSHDESRTIWKTANPLGLGGYTATGWVGRHLAAEYTGSDIPGVNIQDSVSVEFRQNVTSVLAIERLRDFGFPYDDAYSGDTPLKEAAFTALYAAAQGSAIATPHYIGTSGTATLNATQHYPLLHGLYETDRGTFSDLYDGVGKSTARDLREIAKIIYGVSTTQPGVAARFFQLSNGGYDTHSDQGAGNADGQQFQLHAELGASLKVFRDDLVDMGTWDKTVVVVYSEFSRRIQQNDSGTDHGSQGPMFVLGGKVNGGVYGNHPNVDALDDNGNTPYSQDGTDGFRSTDFRDVYGTVLKHWVNMAPADVSTLLPVDGGDPTIYWTAPNFDLTRPSGGVALFKP